MTTKVVKLIKQGGITLLLIVGLLSCEGGIEEVGVNIVDNNLFDTDAFTTDVTAYNQNVEKRIGSRLDEYLLGVYKDDNFGQLDASIISQITFSSTIDFGESPVIDTIIVNIPYQVTNEGDNDDGSIDYELDTLKVIGDESIEYKISIYELQTYLNTLDPENPVEELDYYTDQDYDFNPTPFYSDLFKPDVQDTVLYVKRPEIIVDEDAGIYNVDTIKGVNAAPSIKFALEEDYFTNNFLNNPAIFESTAAFVEFFNGLYIEASEDVNSSASILTLDLSQATMNIYYTNTVGEVRTKQVALFVFNNVINNKYTRDYSGSNAEAYLDNPNMLDGDDKLFVQGAAGSISILDLFVNEDLEELKENNWLINNASVYFYVDESFDSSIAPERLFLYNYEDEQQIIDVLTEGIATFDGVLEYKDDKPYRYQFNITDHVSLILNENRSVENPQLALKAMNNTDIPEGILDIDIEDYNWNPTGIVLHGNQSSNLDKRIKFEITYTELNN